MEKKSLIWMIIEALILLMVLSFVWNHYDNKLDISEQNLIASRSKLEELTLENGNLLFEKDSYILKIKDLETEIGVSKKEIKDLQRKLDSSVAYIAKIEGQYKMDTVYTVKDSLIYVNNDNYIAKFSYEDKWFSINGENNISINNKKIDNINTNLYDIIMNASLTIGITDSYKFFIETDNPYLNINNVNSSAIENSIMVPKKKRFNFGFQMGMGLSYDLFSKSWGVGPYAGAGLQINF